MSRTAWIADNPRLAVQIRDHDIDETVVVEIADSESAARFGLLKRGTGFGSHGFEPPVLQVEEVRWGLPVCGGELVLVHLGINVPVGHDDVLITIIIEIHELHSPTE